MEKLYNVGSYVRLSKENTFADSDSIEHQQEMLSKFISVMPGWIEQKCYIDNGFSGGTFDRPAFLEMMSDVRSGLINLVLVKDLSRFGRNYLEAGNYLENELPALGCRFVSLSESIDTETGENDIMPFLNAMNDYYLKNLSERIKSVLVVKAKDGQKLSGAVPYGYLRSPDDHTRLVVDEYASGIVKRIFALRVQGIGYAKIAGTLNQENILPPRLYYFKRQNRETPQKCTELWFSQTVRSLLTNELYIGHTVQFVQGTRSHRDNSLIRRPKEDWIRVENTHAAIVGAGTWEAVQAVNNRAKAKSSTQRKHQKSLFSGLLYCADCGASMIYNAETHTRKSGKSVTYGSYHCRTYSLTGGSVCTRHAFLFWFFNRIGEAYRLAPGADMVTKVIGSVKTVNAVMADPFPSFVPFDLLFGAVGAAVIYAVVYFKKKNAKKFRKDIEYGSARWGKSSDIKPYVDPKPENNVILTATESLTMSGRSKNPKYARNKNVMVIGGSGSGKTRFFVKPNLMQMHSSYVLTDPKGSIIIECGKLLQRNKYRIKILNTIHFPKSMRYNPFAYLRSETDILTLVTTFIANTQGEQKGGDSFWEKAETLLYTALIAYIYYEAPKEEQHFGTLVEFINAMEVREDDDTFKNAIDLMFDALEAEKPQHFAVRQYRKFKLAAGKTAKSILISCAARLAPFDIQAVRDLLSTDELELDTIGDEKTALFVIISDTNPTFNFIAAMMYSQLFNLLCDKAGECEGGRLPVHVRCLLDEFANVGKIPNFEQLIATIRSREISACVLFDGVRWNIRRLGKRHDNSGRYTRRDFLYCRVHRYFVFFHDEIRQPCKINLSRALRRAQKWTYRKKHAARAITRYHRTQPHGGASFMKSWASAAA